MKFVLRTATMASVLALGVVGAKAADLTVEPAPVAVVAAEAFNWTGFYVGVHAGIGGGSFDTTYTYAGEPGYSEGYNSNAFGAFGGATVGYNYQFSPNWVAGAEADIAYAGIEAKNENTETYLGNEYYSETYKSEIEWFGTIRGRLGYAMDNVLFYGTGGLAYGNVKASYSYDNGDYNEGWSDSETKWGWAAGAGVEYALTKNITMKAEYLYVDLGTASFSGGDFLDGDTVDVDAAFHTAKVGLNYKF